MCRYPGSFRADGAYGQFGVVFPDLDLIVILTTATEQTAGGAERTAGGTDPVCEERGRRGCRRPPLAGAVKERTADLALQPRRGTRNRLWKKR